MAQRESTFTMRKGGAAAWLLTLYKKSALGVVSYGLPRKSEGAIRVSIPDLRQQALKMRFNATKSGYKSDLPSFIPHRVVDSDLSQIFIEDYQEFAINGSLTSGATHEFVLKDAQGDPAPLSVPVDWDFTLNCYSEDESQVIFTYHWDTHKDPANGITEMVIPSDEFTMPLSGADGWLATLTIDNHLGIFNIRGRVIVTE